MVDSVVSVLSRMAFDFGLWSDGASPLLFVCEEAHRYAPADSKIGFGPTRRALSRIAKEGRKYGVFLGLVTQRPAEIDPTIISQCSTLFVMRLSNDRDQVLIRSAVSDAAANLLTFIPSLGTAEVFAFGAGVRAADPHEVPRTAAALRPTSEAGGNTRIAAGMTPGPRPDRFGHRPLARVDHEPQERRSTTRAAISARGETMPPCAAGADAAARAAADQLPSRRWHSTRSASARLQPLGAEPQRPSILRKPHRRRACGARSAPAPTRWR